jgi:hypothetical protein
VAVSELLIVWSVQLTVIVSVAVTAFQVVLPAWVAVIVQVPAPAKVTVVPDNVHTVLGATDTDTVRPEVAVAVTVPVTPTTPVPGAVMLIDWLRCTVIVAVAIAAFQSELPGWEAVIVQVPTAS